MGTKNINGVGNNESRNNYRQSGTTDLVAAVLNLEVFRRLLCDTSAEVELVHLTGLVPQWRDVVHDELSTGRLATRRRRGRSRGALRSLRRVTDTAPKLTATRTVRLEGRIAKLFSFFKYTLTFLSNVFSINN